MTPSEHPTPTPDKPTTPPIEFRAVTSGGDQAVVLYTDGEYDHTIFTIHHNETRDVTARRLAQAFHRVLDMGAMIGEEITKKEQAS